MTKTINCVDCSNAFSYEPPTNFPDKRKYCDACGLKRKEEYNSASQVPKGSPRPDLEDEPVVENITHGTKTITSSGNNTDWEIGNRKVRCRALASAMEYWKDTKSGFTTKNVLDEAKVYEQYILTGK